MARSSIEASIIRLLLEAPPDTSVVGHPPRMMTPQEVAKALNAKLGTVASQLSKMSKPDGPLDRLAGHGPRGGFGYQLRADVRASFRYGYRITRYDMIDVDYLDL